LATAAGYLRSPITHLADRGLTDSYLWQMQALAAVRILREHPD
jgi:cation transport regulator ChaC